jgi:hypothetical protein
MVFFRMDGCYLGFVLSLSATWLILFLMCITTRVYLFTDLRVVQAERFVDSLFISPSGITNGELHLVSGQ